MAQHTPSPQHLPSPTMRRVCLIVHNPRIPSEKHKRLSDVLGWNNPYQLVSEFIRDLYECSYGYVNYRVVETIEVDAFPVKKDGFVYQPDDYVYNFRHARERMHDPDAVNYETILEDYNIVNKVNRGFVDEVWLHAFPWAGYYESHMAGPAAFWCNSPALSLRQRPKRRFVVMGFNYERGVGEMLEAYGHRAESIMSQVYGHYPPEQNMYEKFIAYDKTQPGGAQVGNMHFAPNSVRDYDWGNKTVVNSCADDWFNYPNLKGEMRPVTCAQWGHGDIRAHHKWWFSRLPHVRGKTDGIANNWWQYIADPNLVR